MREGHAGSPDFAGAHLGYKVLRTGLFPSRWPATMRRNHGPTAPTLMQVSFPMWRRVFTVAAIAATLTLAPASGDPSRRPGPWIRSFAGMNGRDIWPRGRSCEDRRRH